MKQLHLFTVRVEPERVERSIERHGNAAQEWRMLRHFVSEASKSWGWPEGAVVRMVLDIIEETEPKPKELS